MPEYLDDPSVLTKERLKNELLAHDVELPGGNPTKDVYVQLYLKNLTAQNQRHGADLGLDAFSSDEELPPPVVSVSRRSRASGRKSVAVVTVVEGLDVTGLTDQGLRDQLLKHGVDVGPIVATTRKLYEKKLQKFLDNGPVITEHQVNHNGGGDTELYSDREDEDAVAPEPAPQPEPEPEPEPVLVLEEPVRSRGKTSSRTNSSSRHTTVEKITAEEPPKEDPVLKDPPTSLNGSGLNATCRRPIKGAATRPVILSDQHHQSTTQNYYTSKTTSTSLSSFTETRNRVSSAAISNTNSASIPNLSIPTSSRSGSSHYKSSTIASTTPATPACQPKAKGMSWWKKLLLMAVLGVFLFFIYQAMETNDTNPFEETEAVPASIGAA